MTLLKSQMRRQQNEHDSNNHHSHHLHDNCGAVLDREEEMIKDYARFVEHVLREHPETRDDDHKLFVWVCTLVCPGIMKEPFGKAFWYHMENGMPSYESITRQRRKLQEQHPHLRGKKYLKRQGKQDEYILKYGRRYS